MATLVLLPTGVEKKRPLNPAPPTLGERGGGCALGPPPLVVVRRDVVEPVTIAGRAGDADEVFVMNEVGMRDREEDDERSVVWVDEIE